MSPSSHALPVERLERLRIAVDLPVTRWSELVGARLREYQALKPTDFLKVDSERLQILSNDLELAPENLLSGQFDYHALSSIHSGDAMSIPERLSVAARSRVRTSQHILDVAEHAFGWRARASILRKLQVSEAYLSNPDHLINLRFLTGICESLKELGVTEKALFGIGGYSATKNYHSALGDLLRSYPTVSDALESIFAELIGKYFDQNFLYSIESARPGLIRVEARCNPDVLDGMSEQIIGNTQLCAARAGTFSTLTSYFRLPAALVTESVCMHRGDSYCRFDIDYSEALAHATRRSARALTPT